MGKNNCFNYNGQYYDIGTKVKLNPKYKEDTTFTYLGYNTYRHAYEFKGLTRSVYYQSDTRIEVLIEEIVEPIYYQEPPEDESKKANIFFQTGSGSAANDDDVFHGFLLYLAVMLGGIIFNDRWLIWIAATLIYFGWKNKL